MVGRPDARVATLASGNVRVSRRLDARHPDRAAGKMRTTVMRLNRAASFIIPFASIVVLVVISPGCSVKRMAINSMADTLAASGDVFASDNDPELVRDAVPFSLKTIESLLVSVPDHAGLLLSACSGFTQYAYAFIQADAEMIEPKDFQAAAAGKDRALKMYVRARDYCLRNLELRHKGIAKALLGDPKAALAGMKKEEVPVLYWTGASWGAAIAIGLDKPDLVADFPVVHALMDRALALDESYSRGAIHEALISLDAVPEAMGGSVKSAREHFDRAVQLTKGLSAGPYVTLAASVSIAAQDRREFESLLNKAMAVDPDKDPSLRLANILTQRRAKFLLSRIDDLFTGKDVIISNLPIVIDIPIVIE
jgi:predicted anti-sigma-YlaC factor YlaD